MNELLKFITTKQAAELWGITQRRVGILCAENRIKNAVMAGKTWLIPAGTKKPTDRRIKGEK